MVERQLIEASSISHLSLIVGEHCVSVFSSSHCVQTQPVLSCSGEPHPMKLSPCLNYSKFTDICKRILRELAENKLEDA